MSFMLDWLTIYKPAIDAAQRAAEEDGEPAPLPLAVAIVLWLVLAAAVVVVMWCAWEEYQRWSWLNESLQGTDRWR